MAKKKDKPQIINNIQELNLEIDYEKLADAIVKSQSRQIEKDQKNSTYTSSTFVLFVIGLFRTVAVVGWSLALTLSLAIAGLVYECVKDGSYVVENIFIIMVALVLMVVLIVYSILLWKSAKEIQKERDRNYIMSVFSGVVSFAALVVALVALFKGVG